MNRFDDFDALFRAATGQEPYPYQARLAADPALPDILAVPTGMGKTAAAVLGWLWRRRHHADERVRAATPRRLVYCLPMRVLVEQTRDAARDWMGGLGEDVPVHTLMGGEHDRDWDLEPERDAVLVGTQDMLLSRALNRGYALSRFRWPVAFGLLNSDALWVLDEVQLMGTGLSTTAQLAALRRAFGTEGTTHTLWMSATLDRSWLATVDHEPFVPDLRAAALTDTDRAAAAVRRRVEARKPLAPAAVSLAAKPDKKKYARDVASLTVERHRPGTLSLVLVNTIERALAVHDAVEATGTDAEVLLLHSRFRGVERRRQRDRLGAALPPAGRIILSTQVVEAGVDLDACLLVTELAPWASLVQRFGRCNRAGRCDDAAVLWLDVDERSAAPYEPAALESARRRLQALNDVGPAHLPPADEADRGTAMLRRRDLRELFDTSADLSGADIDISPFIREGEDRDVRVYWRDGPPDDDEPARPNGDELCAAPIGEVRSWLKKPGGKNVAWRFDAVDGVWERARPETLFPGVVLRLDAANGGYRPDRGLDLGSKTPSSKIPVPVVAPAEEEPAEYHGADHRSERSWQTLAEHTRRVVDELGALLASIDGAVSPAHRAALEEAAWLHDIGKAHPEFQRFLLGDPPAREDDVIWAKSARRGSRHRRRHFRHELASGLALLQAGRSDLVAYLAAAHHGKVRLAVRSFPDEAIPTTAGGPDPERRHALGIWDGETLPAVSLGGGGDIPEIRLDLSLLELGEGPLGPGWTERMLALRDSPDLGPFRLAYLEALLCAADRRASKEDEA